MLSLMTWVTFTLLVFLSRSINIGSIIKSAVLSNCINIMSLSLFKTSCDMLCQNSAKACLDVSSLPPRFIFKAAIA